MHLDLFRRDKQHVFDKELAVTELAYFAPFLLSLGLARVQPCLLAALLAVSQSTESAIEHIFVVFKGVKACCALLLHVFIRVRSTQEKDAFVFFEFELDVTDVEGA